MRANTHTHVYKVNEHSRHLMKKINANFIIINRKKFSIFFSFYLRNGEEIFTTTTTTISNYYFYYYYYYHLNHIVSK